MASSFLSKGALSPQEATIKVLGITLTISTHPSVSHLPVFPGTRGLKGTARTGGRTSSKKVQQNPHQRGFVLIQNKSLRKTGEPKVKVPVVKFILTWFRKSYAEFPG